MSAALLGANALVSAASGAFAFAAAMRPSILLRRSGPASAETRFYAQFYALRQLPLSVAIVAAAAGAGRGALPLLLTVAGAAQAGDAVLGATRRNPGMVLGGALAAVVHLGSAWWWLR